MKELDLDNDDEFRKFCKENGEDYDELHAAAGKHFTAPVRTPWTAPLTREQIEAATQSDLDAIVQPFDYKKISDQARAYCEQQGEDYDELVKRASMHPAFRSDALANPRQLTPEEHKAMLDFINNDEIFGF